MNYAHKPTKIAIVGGSGSGKTTYFLRYLTRTRAVLKFVFDGDEGELADKLKIRPALTPLQLIEQARNGLVCFDPSKMYPGNVETGFKFFCEWTFAVSSKCRGRKLFACDELSKFTDPARLPWEFKCIMETGRRRELDTIFICQRPQDIAPKARQQITEYVALKMGDELPAEFLKTRGFDPQTLMDLPRGRFISRTDDGRETRGKLW